MDHTVIVAQLVRALVCGSRGRRFEPGLSPKPLHVRGFALFRARVGTAFDKPKKIKARSDVYFIQILSKVSRLEASQYPIGTQLPFEI